MTSTRMVTYLDINIKPLLLGEKLHNVQLIRRGSPVDGQSAIVVFAFAELGVDLGEATLAFPISKEIFRDTGTYIQK